LEALRRQDLSTDLWQLLLVDNLSDVPLASNWDISWHPNSRHILEKELGLAAARRRGMREADGDLLVFVDDDNVLYPDYLSEALRISREWPILGVWGSGGTVPEYEIAPAEHLKQFISRQSQKPYWSNVPFCAEATPWGAGLCVRANVAAAYCRHYEQSPLQITGRKGKRLSGGEDTEICIVSCNVGLGVGIFPELKLTHLIPKERVTEKYLLRLVEGSAASVLLLDYKWRGITPRSPLSVRGLVSMLKNILIRRGFDRRLYFANCSAAVYARRIIDTVST
jgi:glycosyltransferase involved in cell wall biosynthesis